MQGCPSRTIRERFIAQLRCRCPPVYLALTSFLQRLPSRRPESRAEEYQSAYVDADDVANLVTAPGMVGRKNIHVVAHHQTGQRHWHQRAMHATVAEAQLALPRV